MRRTAMGALSAAAGVAEGTIDLGEYSLEDVMKGRREGAERMKRLVDLASGIAGGAPQV